MRKGHLILAFTILVMMIVLPAAAVTGDGTKKAAESMPSHTENDQTLEVLHVDTGNVESYSMQDYIFGVVAAEMPMSYPEHALKAQAVAAYTLTLNRMEAREANPPEELKGAHMSDSSATDQSFITREVARAKWGDKAEEYETQLDRWVAEVLGQTVTYNGEPATTVYHSISGGRTESAENVWGSAVPYLVPAESVGDLMSDGYISEKTVTKAEFLQGLTALDSSLSTDLSSEAAVGESVCSESGTVLNITLLGKSFTGQQIREAFSLRSANFDVAAEGDAVKFTVRGYGHLVGMSQFGAKTMAEQGSTYTEILAWYYPGCSVD